MDTQTLTDSLREITANEYEWSFCLYTAKKSKDGMELNISHCAMQGIASFIDETIASLLKKVLPERIVSEYTPFLSKEEIGYMEQTNELIHESMNEIINGINNAYPFSPEDYITGAAPTPTGYIFNGCKKDENDNIIDNIILMKRSNPFIKSGTSRLCISSEGKIVPSHTPILKLPQSADLLLIGGICYILAPNIEKDLGMESRHVAITAKRMDMIADNSMVNNYEELENAAYKNKNARKFVDFDREILDYIVRLPIIERSDFLSKYGLTTDSQGLVDTNDPEQCELLIDLLCCRSCHDALGRLSVGNNIIPR